MKSKSTWMGIVGISIITLVSNSLLANTKQQPDTLLLKIGRGYVTTALKPYAVKYDFFMMRDTLKQQFGTFKESYSIIKTGNEKRGLRIVKKEFGNFSILDSGLCKAKTLEPIYHRSNQTNKIMALDFAGTGVTGTISNKDKPLEKIDLVSTIPLFDSYYEEIIIKCLKFKEGLVFKFPVYWYEKGGEAYITGRVIKKSNFITKNKMKVIAWTVELYDGKEKSAQYIINANTRKFERVEYYENGRRIILEPA
jgi:hypothetical protein